MQKISSIAKEFNIDKIINVTEFGTGLINETYLIETEGARGCNRFVLQKLHPMIGIDVIIDINEITRHLSKKGFLTPTLVKTKKGGLFIEDNQETWRMLTFIDGKTFDKIGEKKQAQSAGSIIGRFHSLLLDCDHLFLHRITNYHDADHIIGHMKNIVFKHNQDSEFCELTGMSEFVDSEYDKIRGSLNHLPERIIHGDLKLSNFIFDRDTNEAISLIDLDTMGRNKIAIDLGDAIRSMCNVNNSFNLETFTYFIDGYFSEAPFLTPEESKSIAPGIEIIILELAARYITDTIEQSYFKLDKSKFPDLYTQNKTKAGYNIELYKDFINKKEIIEEILKNY